MINKVSRRINELMQSQQQSLPETPTDKARIPHSRNISSTPPKSRRSDRLNVSDNQFINYSTTEGKHKHVGEIQEPEDPLNRTRSIHSEQRVFKQFGVLIEHYKSEIVNLIQPLIYQIEDKLMDRIIQLEKAVMQILESRGERAREDLFEREYTLAPNMKSRENEHQEIKSTIKSLVVKASNIQSMLEDNSRSITQRLESLELRYQNGWKQDTIRFPANQCNCQSFIQRILSTQTSLAQQIKFLKHQIQKLKDRK